MSSRQNAAYNLAKSGNFLFETCELDDDGNYVLDAFNVSASYASDSDIAMLNYELFCSIQCGQAGSNIPVWGWL
jgi:hypothetical protein